MWLDRAHSCKDVTNGASFECIDLIQCGMGVFACANAIDYTCRHVNENEHVTIAAHTDASLVLDIYSAM